MNSPAPDLPPKYYLRHFDFLLEFVGRQYRDLLDDDELALLGALGALGEDARCLYVRLSNRRPGFFRLGRLDYAELGDLDAAAAELRRASLTAAPDPRRPQDAGAAAAAFVKSELLTQMRAVGFEVATAQSKAALIDAIDRAPQRHEALLARAAAADTLLRPRRQRQLRLLKFLFFGTPHRDMEQFVIRDLGHRRFVPYPPDGFRRRFDSRRQIDDVLDAYAAAAEYAQLKRVPAAPQLADWYRRWRDRAANLDRAAAPLCDKLALRVARRLERNGQPHAALLAYQDTELPPARERRARLLAKLGRIDDALALCRRIDARPYSAAEATFAADFARRLRERARPPRQRRAAARLSGTTRRLRDAAQIELPGRYRQRVERGVLVYYRARGWRGVFAENRLWRSLFGLLFWDELFDIDSGAIHEPLQRAPSDLYRADFFPRRRHRIDARLALLDRPQRCLDECRRVIDARRGVANPFVVWHRDMPALIAIGCRLIPPRTLRAVLRHIALNPAANGRGFPDLMLWNDRGCRFLEVKSPSDRLSPEQLFWLDFFNRHRLDAEPLRVVWAD